MITRERKYSTQSTCDKVRVIGKMYSSNELALIYITLAHQQ